ASARSFGPRGETTTLLDKSRRGSRSIAASAAARRRRPIAHRPICLEEPPMLRRILLTIAVFAFAAPAPAQLALTQVGDSFSQPLFVTAAPGDTDPNRLFVVEKGCTFRTF